MRHLVLLVVLPRQGLRDPEGETLARLLREKGFAAVQSVHAGRAFLVEVEAGSPEEAVETVSRAARETRLYNPVVHEARVILVAEGGRAQVPRD